MMRAWSGIGLVAATSGALGAEPGAGARLLAQGPTAPGIGGMLASLALVVTLILALAWLARRMQNLPRGGRAGLKVVGGLSLGSRERVVILEFEGRRLLVGVAPGQVRLLDAARAPDFADELARVARNEEGETG